MRRPICLALVAASAVITPAAAQTKSERIVNVYNWTDYIAPNVMEEFTKETGIKVALRHLRFQRHAGDQAAGRQVRL